MISLVLIVSWSRFVRSWLQHCPLLSTETQAHPHRPEELCLPHLRQTFQGGGRAAAPPAGPHGREALPVPALPHALCRAQHAAPPHQAQAPLPPSSHGNAEREGRSQPRERRGRGRSAGGGGGERWMVQLHCVQFWSFRVGGRELNFCLHIGRRRDECFANTKLYLFKNFFPEGSTCNINYCF